MKKKTIKYNDIIEKLNKQKKKGNIVFIIVTMVSLLALMLSMSVSIALIVGAIFLVGLLLFIIRNRGFWFTF